MILTIVGCAGSFPGPASPASCYLLSDVDPQGRTWTIALDLGNGSLGSLLDLGDPHGLDAVVLSHLHPDHCLDMTSLYVFRSYDPAGPLGEKLPVFGPAGTPERLDRAYHTEPGLAGDAGDAQSDLTRAFDFGTLTPGATTRIGPFTVESHLVLHPVEAYALRVTGADGTVVTYSGDTDSCDGLLRAADRADLLLSEAAFEEGRESVRGIHMTGRRAGEAATEAGAATLLLTHIPQWTSRDTVLEEARGAFAGPLGAVARGERYVIDADGVRALGPEETTNARGEA